MDRINSPRDQEHQQIQLLLPWFVTGRLSGTDHARVVAHISTCEACLAEVATERDLSATVTRMPIDVDLGWAALRDRVENTPARPGRQRAARRLLSRMTDRPRAFALLVAAQAAILVTAVAITPMLTRPAVYHALAGAPSPAIGNVIVMFRPDARAADMMALLAQNDARIVDGPTAAGAFVLTVAPAQRAALVARLKMQPALTMAEPIDP